MPTLAHVPDTDLWQTFSYVHKETAAFTKHTYIYINKSKVIYFTLEYIYCQNSKSRNYEDKSIERYTSLFILLFFLYLPGSESFLGTEPSKKFRQILSLKILGSARQLWLSLLI